jgi:hypothetical protein
VTRLGMTKRELDALEKVWIAEINNRLPFQSRPNAKIYKQLEADGMLQFGSEKWGNVTVSGWYLTHGGRFTYCSTCCAGEGV